MNTSFFNLARSLLAFVATVVISHFAAPLLIASKGWTLAGETAVTALLVFIVYTVAYLGIGVAYIVRKQAYDRHIFPEGLRLTGRNAVRLGLRYLIMSSIAAFGATLIYAVILRGMRTALYLQ